MRREETEHYILYSVFPFLTWIKGYSLSFFLKDLIAGTTVAVVLIPQSMAYAMLAGLPSIYGLYAAAVTPLVAALWGSLRQLATGPIAIMSLLVLTSLAPLAEPGSPQFIELAFLLAFMVGIIYLIIGLFHLGELMSFISHSAIKGFTAAASLIIISTQLPHLLGITMVRHEYILQMFLEIIKNLPSMHYITLIIGMLSFILIYVLKKSRPNFPSGLLALVLSSIPVAIFNMNEMGVAIVGKTLAGLPSFHMPDLVFETISSLIGPALVISIVSFAETYSVGKAISSSTKQRLNVNQEFIGQGLANLIGSFFQSYPVSGSFSRTAINYAAGAKTGTSSVVSSIVVILALLFLTPLFTYIPRASLAALVITSVLILFHPREVFALWKMNRHDGIVAVTVFGLALLTKPDYALLIGVMISLIFFLWKTMHPRIVRITKDPEMNMFVNADRNRRPGCPQILQLRSDNVIYFANAEYTVEHIIERLDEQETPIKFLLLDFQAMGFIDITGIDGLRTLQEEIKGRGVELAMMDIHLPVREVMISSGFIKEIKQGHIIENRGRAISFLFERIDHEYCKKVCPYELFFECSTVK